MVKLHRTFHLKCPVFPVQMSIPAAFLPLPQLGPVPLSCWPPGPRLTLIRGLHGATGQKTAILVRNKVHRWAHRDLTVQPTLGFNIMAPRVTASSERSSITVFVLKYYVHFLSLARVHVCPILSSFI